MHYFFFTHCSDLLNCISWLSKLQLVLFLKDIIMRFLLWYSFPFIWEFKQLWGLTVVNIFFILWYNIFFCINQLTDNMVSKSYGKQGGHTFSLYFIVLSGYSSWKIFLCVLHQTVAIKTKLQFMEWTIKISQSH